MKGIFKRGIALFITATMIMSALTGCGKAKDGAGDPGSTGKKDEKLLEEAKTQSKDYVFKTEDLVVDGLELRPGDYVDKITMVGDRVYCTVFESNVNYRFYSFDQDGSGLECSELPVEDCDFYKSTCFLSDGSGYSCLNKRKTENDEVSKQEIVKFDSKGNITQNYDCSKLGDGEKPFYVNSLVAYDNGEVYATTNRGLETFSFDEGFNTIVKIEENGENALTYSSQLMKTQTDSLVVFDYVDDLAFYTYAPDEKKLVPMGNVDTANLGLGVCPFIGAGHDIYLSAREGIWSFDKDNDAPVKLLDCLDSDISLNGGLEAIYALSSDEFIAAMLKSDGYKFVKFTKIPPEQVKDKKVLTLATISVDNLMSQVVTKFNNENDEYKINLVEYGSLNDTDFTEGEKKLDMDIVSGNVPDIMTFWFSSTEKYSDKGLFLDLKPYYDRDKKNSDIELLPNIENMLTKDGKMYTFITDFAVGTVATKKKFTEGKKVLTIEDCQKLIEAKNCPYEIAFGFMTKEQILSQGIMSADKMYIDTEKNECHFDSDSFIKLLEFANNFPKEVNFEKYDSDFEAQYRSEVALFYPANIPSFQYYMGFQQAIFGDDVSFIGFPNDQGADQSLIYPSAKFAISSQTKYPDAAWEFIKMLTDEEFMSQKSQFPATKSAFEASAKKALEQPYDEFTGENEVWSVGGVTTKLKPLTQDQVDELKEYILSINTQFELKEDIYKIILEEAPAYFEGQKSAEEVASIIQNRAQICLSENG